MNVNSINAARVATPQKTNVAFGGFTDAIATGLGKIGNSDAFVKTVEKIGSSPNLMANLSTASSAVTTGLYIYKSLTNEKMDKKERLTLALNQALTFGVSTLITYTALGALKKTKANLRQKILEIQNHTNAEEVKKYNSAVTGIQNYYRIASNIYNNLTEVDYALLRTRNNRLRKKAKIVRFCETPSDFKKKTTGIRDCKKIYRIMDIHMLPITGVHHKSPMNFSQEICNYTEKGRKKIHNNQRAVE